MATMNPTHSVRTPAVARTAPRSVATSETVAARTPWTALVAAVVVGAAAAVGTVVALVSTVTVSVPLH